MLNSFTIKFGILKTKFRLHGEHNLISLSAQK